MARTECSTPRLFPIILFAVLVLVLMGCTAGPPRIISVESGTEVSFHPAQTAAERFPYLVVIADDPDGSADLASVRVSQDNGEIYWEWQREDFQIVEKDGSARIILRRPYAAASTLAGPATVLLRDRAGNETSMVTAVQPMLPLEGLDLPKAERSDAGLTITAQGTVRLTLVGYEGQTLASREVQAGQLSWAGTGLRDQGPEMARVYLQTFQRLGNVIITTGPW